MPTKYVEVDGYAVNYFHTGQTTLPSVTPGRQQRESTVVSAWCRQQRPFRPQDARSVISETQPVFA